MKLQAAQVQKLALTQSMRQSLTFLQLPAVDLSQAVQEAALSNPLLEVTEPDFGRVAVDVARPEEDPAPVFQESELWPRYAPRGRKEAPPVPERAESFAEYLEGQLGTIPYLDARLRELCRYLIGCLNSAGYLDCPLTELAEELGVPLFEMEQALLAIQTLDPPGVGARDLSECLLLQLAQGKHFTEENIRLLRAGLPLLAEEDWDGLARLLGVSREQAKRDAAVIRSLNPIPSRGFASAERPVYLVPEATVSCRDGEVLIEMERGSQPKVELNQYYCSLLGSGEGETRDYLRRMMAEANELISGLQSREKTLRQILGAIVKGQRDFFLKGAALAPLTMQQVAEELGLSTSTVSRAVKDKYLSFQGRSLALRSFFVAALPTGEGVSPQTAREHIRRFIAAEDPALPLSDEALREALGNLGINASRRTVAKYRGEMGIPSSAQRKRG